MTPTTITVEATLQPDGVTLQLEKKLSLPPGRVTVIVQPTAPVSGPTMLTCWIAFTGTSSSGAARR
jgi:hypothetical protein